MSSEITTEVAGDILDMIPNVLKNHAITDVIIKTPGEVNKLGGIKFLMTLDNISLKWDVIKSEDGYEITYDYPFKDEYVEYSGSDTLPYTETVTEETLSETFDELTQYLLDTAMEEE